MVTVSMNTNARNGENSDKERGRQGGDGSWGGGDEEEEEEDEEDEEDEEEEDEDEDEHLLLLVVRVRRLDADQSEDTRIGTRPSLLMATLPRSGALPSTGTLAFGRHPASATRACCHPAAFSSHDDRTSTARHVLPLLERPSALLSPIHDPPLPFLSLSLSAPGHSRRPIAID